MLTLRILPEAVLSVGIRYGTTSSGADTYRDDQKFLFPSLFCQGGRGIHGIFSIAQNDEGVGAVRGGAFKVLHGTLENAAEVCATGCHPFPVDVLQRFLERHMVVGEGDH